MPTPTALPLSSIRITGGVLGERVERVGTVTLLRQWDALNDRIPGAPHSHAVRNLRIAAGDETGSFDGLCFQDSDVAKWLEAACYRVSFEPTPELSAAIAELVDLYERAQEDDGYLHTYTQLTPGAERWENLRDLHELYCFGHFIEAAVAHCNATGSHRLLAVATKLADLLVKTFGDGADQIKAYPGHPELELALVKLARASGEIGYRNLAEFFVRERGRSPHYFVAEAERRQEKVPPVWSYFDEQAYWQAHVPVTEQTEPRGHAVRAMYLYCAMADLAREADAPDLRESCERLWREMVAKHLYIIGGVGADGPGGENFSEPYDLPDDRSYAETCAAIGVMMWARRMLDLSLDSQYADVMELALYNNVLAGLSQDACHYFYVNPLAVNPGETRRRYDCKMVKTQRVPWFGCACCPPNVARLLSSLGAYAVSHTETRLALHLFAPMQIDHGGWSLRVETDYPWQESVRIVVEAAPDHETELAIRAARAEWTLNDTPLGPAEKGYVKATRVWRCGDVISANIPLPIERVRAHPRVTSAVGRVALARGPVIYAVEEADHGAGLPSLGVTRDAELSPSWEADAWGGIVTINGKAIREAPSESLYQSNSTADRETVSLRAIPYAWWGNRGEGEMRVWLRDYES
ncbi:MAG: glycoside hydrolase family 127 protein [Synoicihabitans sp.]